MKASLQFWLGLAYILFGSGIAALASSKGMEMFGWQITERWTQCYGVFCLTLGAGWMAKLHAAMFTIVAPLPPSPHDVHGNVQGDGPPLKRQ